MCRKAHIIRAANIIRRSRHHLPQANIIQKNAPLSVDKSAFFVGARNGTGSRTAVLGQSADLVVHRKTIQPRLPFKPHFSHKIKKNDFCRSFLVRETGLEPVRTNHTPLKRARLPVPPLSHIKVFLTLPTYYTKTFSVCQYLFEKIFSFFQYTLSRKFYII